MAELLNEVTFLCYFQGRDNINLVVLTFENNVLLPNITRTNKPTKKKKISEKPLEIAC